MNFFERLYISFQNRKISKSDYIDKAYEQHDYLFEYANWLPHTDIKNIIIEDKKVYMTTRESDLTFLCKKGDKRLATLDVLNFRDYEKKEFDFQLLLIDDEASVLDIGGNYGWYAIHLAKEKPQSTIYSIEPLPTTYFQLVTNIITNQVKNVVPFNFGFSDVIGIFEYYINPKLSVNASLKNVADNKDAKKVLCLTRTVDNFIEEQDIKLDFIKCDVEGAEFLVFKGGERTIRKQQPVVFTEMLRKWSAKFDYHPNDMISWFKELNYSCFIIIDKKSISRVDAITNDTEETNFIFLHNKKHSDKIKAFNESKL